MKKLIALFPLLITLLIFPHEAVAVICNIKAFLDDCPTLDPAYAQIRSDFQLRRDGQLVGDIACQEPVSQMPIDEYTDELIVLQGLRMAYYMDRGQPGQFPWTAGTFYSWLKQKIGGINITSTGQDECCFTLGDGRLYFYVRANDDFSRNFDRQWQGIADNIGLMAHERRHLDGSFSHVDCCPAGDNACDQTYDVHCRTIFVRI